MTEGVRLARTHNLPEPIIDFMHMHLEDDIIVGGPFRAHHGTLTVPDGPGLGVTIDEDKLAEYAELALSEKSRDRYVDPSTPDARRPGWFPVQPKW